MRGGAEAMGEARGRAERDRIPVEDTWDIPKDSRAWRGQNQLGSLGGGNHFIELQHDGERLWVMYHTGSRGFGHGLATHYFEKAREELALGQRARWTSATSRRSRRHWRSYRNAVAAGGNYAIANRLLIGRAVARRVRGGVRRRGRPVLRDQPQPRAGGDAPRPVPAAGVDPPQGRHARPARGPPDAGGHALAGDRAPRPDPRLDGRLAPTCCGRCPGAARSLYSVNHGCGRRKSRDGRASARSRRPRPSAACATWA